LLEGKGERGRGAEGKVKKEGHSSLQEVFVSSEDSCSTNLSSPARQLQRKLHLKRDWQVPLR
jgi:hypothetical protein